MRTKTWKWLPAALVLMGLAGTGAEGTILTFAMEGEITSKNDPLGLLDFAHTGDRVVYTFTFDTDAPDSNPAPNIGRYDGLAALLEVGETGLAIGIPGMVVQEPNTFWVGSSLNLGSHAGALYFALDDQDFTAIPSTDLPTTPYELSLFESPYFQFGVYGPPIPPSSYPTFVYFSGPIDSFYLVPEPCAFFIVGFGILFVIRRRPRGAST